MSVHEYPQVCSKRIVNTFRKLLIYDTNSPVEGIHDISSKRHFVEYDILSKFRRKVSKFV